MLAAPVDWEYLDLEAARFFGYRLGDWQQEHFDVRARVIAHYLEHNLREEYGGEKARQAAEKGGPPAGDPPKWAGGGSPFEGFEQRRKKAP